MDNSYILPFIVLYVPFHFPRLEDHLTLYLIVLGAINAELMKNI